LGRVCKWRQPSLIYCKIKWSHLRLIKISFTPCVWYPLIFMVRLSTRHNHDSPTACGSADCGRVLSADLQFQN
jgi:hypothetical protein